MKYKAAAFFTALILVISFTGCLKSTIPTNANKSEAETQKAVVVVVDKQTKAPIKDAKIYIMGDSTLYTTDEMGKTPEFKTELNKSYFSRYIDEVVNRVKSGFVSIVVVKDGYAKHLEKDYCVYPGDSISVIKIELAKGKNLTSNCNVPDINYIENVVKSYEKFEGQGTKTDNMVKYKVTVVDEKKKPIEGVKIVIPEAGLSMVTDKNALCQFDVPYDENEKIAYPVKRDYGEITLLAYKEGYMIKAVINVQVNKDGKNNSIIIKMKKADKGKIDYEIIHPKDKWVEDIINNYKQ